MIKFALRCGHGHKFESWFPNGAAFDALAASGRLDCPECGDTRIEKALMAPAIGRAPESPEPPPQPNGAQTPPAPASSPEAPASPPAAVGDAAVVRRRVIEGKLRALRAHVEASAEAVGGRFAEEARAIHDGDAPERPIYGDAEPDEVEALVDEGVPVLRIPWIDRRDD